MWEDQKSCIKWDVQQSRLLFTKKTKRLAQKQTKHVCETQKHVQLLNIRQTFVTMDINYLKQNNKICVIRITVIKNVCTFQSTCECKVIMLTLWVEKAYNGECMKQSFSKRK